MGPIIPILMIIGFASALQVILTQIGLLQSSVTIDGTKINIDMSNLSLFNLPSGIFYILSKVLLNTIGIFSIFNTVKYFNGNPIFGDFPKNCVFWINFSCKLTKLHRFLESPQKKIKENTIESLKNKVNGQQKTISASDLNNNKFNDDVVLTANTLVTNNNDKSKTTITPISYQGLVTKL